MCIRDRNSYDPQMVENFRRQVREKVVPLVAKLKEKQAQRLGIDHVAMYDDTIMTLEGNPKPVIEEDELYKAGVELYRQLSPQACEMIDRMDQLGAFDPVSYTQLDGYKRQRSMCY